MGHQYLIKAYVLVFVGIPWRLFSPVSELLYAVQWCVEMDLSLPTVSQHHSLLTDWGSSGCRTLVPVTDLLQTLYSR